MKKIIKFLLKSIAVLVILFSFFQLWAFGIFYWDFMRITNISMQSFDDKPYQMNIPVRYLDRWLTDSKGARIGTANQWRYSFRKGDAPGEMWITICRLGFGGLAVYTARYEITDSEVRKKLLELWNAENLSIPGK